MVDHPEVAGSVGGETPWQKARRLLVPTLLLVPIALPLTFMIFVWLGWLAFAFVPMRYIGISAKLLLADIEVFKDFKIVPELVPPVIAIALIALGKLRVSEQRTQRYLIGYGVLLYLSLGAFTIFLEANLQNAEAIIDKENLTKQVIPGLNGLIKVLRLIALSCVALTIQRLLPPRPT